MRGVNVDPRCAAANALIRSSLPGIASAVSVMLLGASTLLIVPFFARRTDRDDR